MSLDALKTLLTKDLEVVSRDSEKNPFDYVIVGAGTTGLVFASVLVNAGRRVLLLEAGSLILLNHVNNSELRFNNEFTRSLQRTLSYSPKTSTGASFGSFVSCFGGRGLFWNGASPRFSNFDFDHWPISYELIAPYYEKAEKAFNVTTSFGDSGLTQFICRNLRLHNIDASPGPYAVDVQATKDGIISSTIGNGISIFMSSGALSNINKNITISTDCFVNRVILNDKKTHAKGVAVTDRRTQKNYEILANAIVLTGGAFESTRIALNSAIPDAQNLIGKYIGEHIFCRAYFPVPPIFYGSKAEAAIIHIPGTKSENYQIEIHLPGARLMRIKNRNDWNVDDSTNYAAMMRSFGSVQPRKENRIEISGPESLGGYTVYMEYEVAETELRSAMISKMEAVRKILGLGEAKIEELPSGSSYHECGGLRMGSDPLSSVCDSYGRFHAIRNLISGDAACWPSISCANPHLTLAALAFYKADKILEQKI